MIDFSEGARLVGNGLSLPYIWTSLHLNAQMEQDILTSERLTRETARVEREIRSLLTFLGEVSTSRWWSMSEAAGWTIYSVIGLSWCKDANADDFWAAWDAVPYDLVPEASIERPMAFVNRKIMPQTRVLTEMVKACGGNGRRVSFAIAALQEPLVIDLTDEQIEFAEPEVLRAFIRSRLGTALRSLPEEDDASALAETSATSGDGGPEEAVHNKGVG